MKDNGLLAFYKEQKESGKLLCLKKLPIVSMDTEGYVSTVNVTTQPNKVVKYYLKTSGALERISEILLSQIYAKAGFETSTYLPILDSSEIKVISEEAETENVVLANNFVILN